MSKEEEKQRFIALLGPLVEEYVGTLDNTVAAMHKGVLDEFVRYLRPEPNPAIAEAVALLEANGYKVGKDSEGPPAPPASPHPGEREYHIYTKDGRFLGTALEDTDNDALKAAAGRYGEIAYAKWRGTAP